MRNPEVIASPDAIGSDWDKQGEIMNQTVYADGIANVTMVDGVVRFELINIVSMDKGKATLRPVITVATSLSGLLRTHEQLAAVIGKMVQQGVLKKTEPPAPVSKDVAVAQGETLQPGKTPKASVK